MGLIQIIIVIVVIGVIMWAINTYIPMAEGLKRVLNVAVIIIVCLWLLSLVFGANLGAIRL